MKKLIYCGLFLAIVGIGIVGCMKKNEDNSNNEKRLRVSHLDSIGIEHQKVRVCISFRETKRNIGFNVD
jgi:hypothetical protein